MKKFVVPALVLAAASVALPAAAQSYGQPYRPAPSYGYHHSGYGSWQSINQRQATLDRRIDNGLRNRTLSWREATRLRGEFQAIARLEANYRRGGLSNWERADLDRRFDRLAAQIRSEKSDWDNRRG
jgi:hypothetical protein